MEKTATGSGLSVVVPAALEETQGALLYERLEGIPLVARTLMALDRAAVVDEVIVVVWEQDLTQMADLCTTYALERVRKIVCTKQAGTAALAAGIYECDPTAEFIAIHDPLRPFVTAELIEKALKAAKRIGVAAPALPVRDTIKIVEHGTIQSTPDRRTLYTLQSPSVVESSLLKAALQRADEQGVLEADLAILLEGLDVSHGLSQGADENIRISDRSALPAAAAILTWEG
ncbi:MAG: 2-C-methyl-D-erythritol 4-phosphate cytidylyltransferase [Oscillospiraceae bacterium]|nr:2-C-methyl-D-erythritol 4-phosphate cytidylyltransferase [Oscillospiraceae bacterium]